MSCVLKNEIRDEWMDNIDWVKIKEKEKKYGSDDEDDEDQEEANHSVDKVSYFKQMIEIMQVTVLSSLWYFPPSPQNIEVRLRGL